VEAWRRKGKKEICREGKFGGEAFSLLWLYQSITWGWSTEFDLSIGQRREKKTSGGEKGMPFERILFQKSS